MEIDHFIQITIIILSVLASAFFSGSEAALFTLDKEKLKATGKNSNITFDYLSSLLESPRRLLITITLGNTFVNIIIAVQALWFTFSYFGNSFHQILVTIAVVSAVILFIGEIAPKILASRNPEAFARISAIPLYWINIILYPFSKTISDIIKYFTTGSSGNKLKSSLFSYEIDDIAEISIVKGNFEEEEQELIQGVVAFKTVTVHEVMTPRVDIVAVSKDQSFDDLLKIITESGHSRIPLFKSNLDEIEGIIYVKDLLPYLHNKELRSKISLNKIARKPFFVPQTKLIRNLMQEFQQKNIHLGIVVDEYGGTAGLISLEDILEEIVGDIRDEYDEDETRIVNHDENELTVIGKVTVDEIFEETGTDLSSEEDDYDTIGGFILTQAGKIPETGYSCEYGGYRFTVTDIHKNRINKVLIEKIEIPDSEFGKTEIK